MYVKEATPKNIMRLKFEGKGEGGTNSEEKTKKSSLKES